MPSRACASQLRRSERGLAVVRRRASTVVAFGLLVGPLFTRVALADEPTDPATATPVESPIEEIVVTARRDEEPMQSVPVAVSAFTSADLTRAAPHTLLDLDGLSPNVFIGKNPAGPAAGAIFIRGIGYADIEKTQSPQVGVIVDGVFQGTNTGQLIDLFDVEQLEIDRGPQGVLYGKNTMGGMIVVRRVEPLFDEWHVALSVAGGSRAMGRFKGRLNVPLIEDKLALKVAAVSMQQRGDTWNRTLQRSVGGTDYQTYTAALAWKPTERARALLTYDHIADHSGSTAFDALYDGAQPFETLADYAGFMRYDVDSVGLQASWDGALGTLSSVTAYVDSRDDVGQDFDGSSSAISYAAPIDQLHTLRQQHFQQFTEEARLSGNLGERVAYMVGGFFYDTTLNFYQGTNGGFQFANPLFPSQTCDQIGFRSNPSFGNLCQTPNSASSSIVREAVRSSAVFGELRWRPFDSFELAVGLRYISERRSFSSSDFESRVPPGSIEPPRRVLIVGGPPPGFPVASRQRWARTLAKITATWTVSDRSHVYASYAGGFRSGGFSLRGLDEETLSFGPESANAYEIGSKSDLWGRRWRLNLAAFLTQQKGAQFLTFVPLPDGGVDNIINNANESRIYGLEAESALVVTPEFRLIASLGVQNASSDPIRISSRRAPFPENDGTPQQGQACNPIANPSYFPNAPSTKGNTCPDVTLPASTLFRFPHYNWSLTGVLTRGFGDDALEASVSWKGMGRFALDSIAGREIDQPSYSTLDFNLSYAWKLRNGDALRLAFVGKNVLSKKYLGLHLYLAGDASNGTGYSGFQSWGPPRTLEIELSYEH